MKLTPQQKQILDLLDDMQKHCFTVELYMKDDRSRISELRKMGYRFNEGAGYCTNPDHHHTSKVKLRQRLIPLDEHDALILEAEAMRNEEISNQTTVFTKQLKFI